MFTKVLIICAIATVALCVEYPPGINPALCPNYPYCDMELLARYAPQALPISDWMLYPYARAVYAPYPIIARAIAALTDAPAPTVESAKYPADFDASLCPNYPFCE